MKGRDFSKHSVEDLWALHETITRLLSSRLVDEQARLDDILKKLQGQVVPRAAKRPYPPVSPKFRNPVEPSETWAGRGKRPRWLLAALKKGKRLEDFKIPA
jgi:DNA-binding protein H-NS